MDFVFVRAQVERKRMLRMAAAQGAYAVGTEELVLVKYMALRFVRSSLCCKQTKVDAGVPGERAVSRRNMLHQFGTVSAVALSSRAGVTAHFSSCTLPPQCSSTVLRSRCTKETTRLENTKRVVSASLSP